jgi:hypothetical protein
VELDLVKAVAKIFSSGPPSVLAALGRTDRHDLDSGRVTTQDSRGRARKAVVRVVVVGAVEGEKILVPVAPLGSSITLSRHLDVAHVVLQAVCHFEGLGGGVAGHFGGGFDAEHFDD